jgi:hypothetical protein
MTTTTVTNTTDTPLERLYDAAERGVPIDIDVFTNDVVLDATVPMWRFHRHGAAATAAELGRWFADAGRFEEFQTFALPGGALVEFILTWEQQGVPHACHQSHRLELDADGRIRRLHAWCGGRWPASLLADMAEAEQAIGAQQ